MVHHVTAGLLPHRLVDDAEEERRVLHVALTRGRTTVTVVAGTPPSSFLGELAEPGEPPPKAARAGGGEGRPSSPAARPPMPTSTRRPPPCSSGCKAWRAEKSA